MEEIKNLLEARENYLLQLKKEKEEALKMAPEGSLRVCSHGNRTQFYKRTNPKDFNGVYIREKDIKLAQELAQKDYDKKVLSAINKELGSIRKYYLSYPDRNAEQIYEIQHKERQKLIVPIRQTDEQYIKNWESVKYQGKEFSDDAPEFYTDKGERVRSKSEIIIANILKSEGIPYRYEYPIYLKGMGRIYPDFTLLNMKKREEIFLEHLGMMDDYSYMERAINKIDIYEKNGIYPGKNLILTHETRKNPLNQRMIKNIIQNYFD